AFNSLRQNYPNPLRLAKGDFTTLEYFVREDVDISIKIYNLAGELVCDLYSGRPGIGRHAVYWYGDNGSQEKRGKTVGSGVYIAVFQSGEYKEMKKVVVIR
ncbi:T9SS type A sorting domain-containing protein, partial [candidate division FCPU426 bacterium]|nr:T9SS type A sorting domain-containing protein [candidate division FCPU426 bacterium]